jgi:hypothetical protein
MISNDEKIPFPFGIHVPVLLCMQHEQGGGDEDKHRD